MGALRNSLDHHWMPFTANRAYKSNPRMVTQAKGMYYISHDGRPIIDACSGLFCSALGHCRDEITHAVSTQLSTLDYTPHFNIAAPASFELASKLANIAPRGLNRVFFANSGSEAVDSSLKMVMAYHRANGEAHRNRWVSRENAYHGMNIGGTSLSGMVNNRRNFGAVMPGVVHMRHTWLSENAFTFGRPTNGVELAEDLARFCATLGGDNIAAVYVEPVAGSIGAFVPPIGYLERIREICDQHGILLVFDEVICGFGRLGGAFGSQVFGVTPDMITVAKALTNGAVPMGAVIASDKVYNTIVEKAPTGTIELFHGYTYSAHPVACAASLATLNVYQDEDLFSRAKNMEGVFQKSLKDALGDLEIVTDLRGVGMMAGFDLAPSTAPGARGAAVCKDLFEAGLHIKFTGDSAVIAPALIAEESHISEICDKLHSVISRH